MDESRSRTESPAPSAPNDGDTNLINVKIPTQTKKSQKRKHIRTEFDDEVDSYVIEAQKREKERLERLEKSKPVTNHIQDMESLFLQNPTNLPNLDISDLDFGLENGDLKNFDLDEILESKPNIGANQASTSANIDYVDLTLEDSEEEDEDDIMITGVLPRRIVPGVPHISERRFRWAQAEKDRDDFQQMEHQYTKEASRIMKMRDQKALESTEKQGGRLLVNAGHPAEDPDVFVISHLTHVLQPHQLGGIRFMYDNTVESFKDYKETPGFGCILAHSMGLGKTIQVITFSEIFLRATKSKKVLVIVPINTIQNWNAEYDKWIPKLSETGDKIRSFEVFLLGDGVKTFDQRVNLIEQWDQKGGILLIGYDMFRMLIKQTQPKKEKKKRPKLNLNGAGAYWMGGDPMEEMKKKQEEEQECGFTQGGRVKAEANDLLRRALLDPGPELVVCDEGHKIKNLNTDIAVALSAIKTRRRIVLTGYPLQNNLMEYYCMIDFVRPKYLGSKKAFIDRFEKPIKNGQCMDSTPNDIKIARQRTHVLVELVKGFVQRRTHHLLKSILPESREYVLLLRKSPIQRALYRNFVLYATNEMKNSNNNTFNPLKAFSACSKIWNHPDILFNMFEDKKKDEQAADEKRRQVEMMNNYFTPPGYQQMQNPMMMNFGFGQNSPFSASNSMPASPASVGKPKKKGRPKKQTMYNGVNYEEDSDEPQGMTYEWAENIFGTYCKGIVDNGYKMIMALEILDESTKIGEKILIFSQNLTALACLEEFMSRRQVQLPNGEVGPRWEKNRNYLRFDGSTSGADREKLINRFNSDPKLHVFLISTRAGSLGINLVSANRCIIVDACWNPCHDAQAVCRVYRYGQQRRTFIYRLIMDNSMERSIFNRQISKHGLQQRVVDDVQVDANISQKELETLLMYDESLDINTDRWNTSDWGLDDDLLKKVTDKFSHLLSEKPFLHESLILESDKILSEEEKREAQLLFEQEKRAEMTYNDPMSSIYSNGQQPTSSYSNGLGVSASMYQNQNTPFNPNYQMPKPMSQMNGMNQLSHHSNNLPYATNSYNGGVQMNQNYQMPVPVKDPSAFPGAAQSQQAMMTSGGITQNVITDRAIIMPHTHARSRLQQLPAGTHLQIVIPKQGLYARMQDGTILDATGSVFEQQARHLRSQQEQQIAQQYQQPMQVYKSEPEIIQIE